MRTIKNSAFAYFSHSEVVCVTAGARTKSRNGKLKISQFINLRALEKSFYKILAC